MKPTLDWSAYRDAGMGDAYADIPRHGGNFARAVAERDLMPALRAAPDARIVANGFSCRTQMRAHGDHRAQHLAVLLRDALVEQRPS